jgi:hypothetical protein
MLGSVLHRCRTELVTAGGLTLIGLPLGPLTMRPIYQQTSPALGGATLLVVEVLFALLIDFPLATTASVLVCGRRRSTKPTDGIRAALLALAVFFGAILVCLPIGNAVPGVGQLALQDVFPPAVSRAQATFGTPTLGILAVLFLAFDLTLGALGGLAGYHVADLIRRHGDAVQDVDHRGSAG